MDFTTLFPYALIAVLVLFAIGIYAIITGKYFLRVVMGIEVLLIAVNLLLLSFSFTETSLMPNSLTQVISIFILIISVVFLIVGISINRRLRQSGDSTLLEFTFEVEGLKRIRIEKKEESSTPEEGEEKEEKGDKEK